MVVGMVGWAAVMLRRAVLFWLAVLSAGLALAAVASHLSGGMYNDPIVGGSGLGGCAPWVENLLALVGGPPCWNRAAATWAGTNPRSGGTGQLQPDDVVRVPGRNRQSLGPGGSVKTGGGRRNIPNIGGGRLRVAPCNGCPRVPGRNRRNG